MTTDPTLADASADALDAFTDYIYHAPWPFSRDPLAVRDFLAGVAGYSNSLAGLPLQAELEDRIKELQAERDAARADRDALLRAAWEPPAYTAGGYIEIGNHGNWRIGHRFGYEDDQGKAYAAIREAVGLCPRPAGAATTGPREVIDPATVTRAAERISRMLAPGLYDGEPGADRVRLCDRLRDADVIGPKAARSPDKVHAEQTITQQEIARIIIEEREAATTEPEKGGE